MNSKVKYFILIIFFNISAEDLVFPGECISSINRTFDPIQDAPTYCTTKCRDKSLRYYSHYCNGMNLVCTCKLIN